MGLLALHLETSASYRCSCTISSKMIIPVKQDSACKLNLIIYTIFMIVISAIQDNYIPVSCNHEISLSFQSGPQPFLELVYTYCHIIRCVLLSHCYKRLCAPQISGATWLHSALPPAWHQSPLTKDLLIATAPCDIQRTVPSIR